MSRQLPSKPNLEYLKKEAKDLLATHQRRDPTCCATLRVLSQFSGAPEDVILTTKLPLSEVQFALALDYGFAGWNELVAHVAGTVTPAPSPEDVEKGRRLTAECEAEMARLPVSARKTEELIPLLVEFARSARWHGLVGLDAYPERIDEELLRLGLRLVVDGTDRGYVHDILNARKKSLLAALERRLDVIIAGCDGVSEGMNPHLLAEKCRAIL